MSSSSWLWNPNKLKYQIDGILDGFFFQQYCNTLHAGVIDFSAIWSLKWR